MVTQRVLLIILDGWGLRQEAYGNAIAQAHPEFYNHLIETYPYITLQASGEAVGLPDHQMGNSETGHLNIGAGRVVEQSIVRINHAIAEDSFFHNKALLEAIAHVKSHQSALHLMGLASDGGVHSRLGHLMALLDLAKQQGVEHVYTHAFTDGRDTPPKSAEAYLMPIQLKLGELGFPPIMTMAGRFYAMDRDNRWERIEKAYNNLVAPDGPYFDSAMEALMAQYEEGLTDEFIPPLICEPNYRGMHDGDAIIFFNFRPDRQRELTEAFITRDFNAFPRRKVIQNLSFTSLAIYGMPFKIPVAFPKPVLEETLGQVLSEHDLHQLRVAETEKYAHITYFLSGEREEPFPGETRDLIPSPRIKTYDLKPEMSLPEIETTVIKALQSNDYQFIAVNFANPDMVGHTGNLEATGLAIKAVDKALKEIINSALEHQWVTLVTADHGNAELMKDANGNPLTAHTSNPVPLILVSNNTGYGLDQIKDAKLADIAPTILDLMGLPIPEAMSCPSLLKHPSLT